MPKLTRPVLMRAVLGPPDSVVTAACRGVGTTTVELGGGGGAGAGWTTVVWARAEVAGTRTTIARARPSVVNILRFMFLAPCLLQVFARQEPAVRAQRE